MKLEIKYIYDFIYIIYPSQGNMLCIRLKVYFNNYKWEGVRSKSIVKKFHLSFLNNCILKKAIISNVADPSKLIIKFFAFWRQYICQ